MVVQDAPSHDKSRTAHMVFNRAKEKWLVAFLYGGNNLWKTVQEGFHLPQLPCGSGRTSGAQKHPFV